MKILVTGASGFIGSFICEKLANKYRVIAVVSPFSQINRLKVLKSSVEIVKLDLSNSVRVERLLKKYKPEVVLHLATHGVYQYQQKDKKRIVIDNYLMTLNLLESSVKNGVKKFINTGSVFEYGSQKRKVKEKEVNLNDILNDYSAVKIATTALTCSYSDKLKVITLRPFTTYGQGEDKTRFIRATIDRALKDEDIKIVKGVVRDFIHVEDVALGFYKAIVKNFVSGEIVNIASGHPTSLEDAARLIKKILHSESKIIFDQKYKRYKESACWADITHTKKVLNWVPKYSFEEGIIKSIDSIKK